jgi:hypothetical protein
MKSEYRNKLLSDLAQLDSQLSIEKSKKRELISNIKTIKFMLAGHEIDCIEEMEDIEAMKYNIKNAVNYINTIIKEVKNVESSKQSKK